MHQENKQFILRLRCLVIEWITSIFYRINACPGAGFAASRIAASFLKSIVFFKIKSVDVTVKYLVLAICIFGLVHQSYADTTTPVLTVRKVETGWSVLVLKGYFKDITYLTKFTARLNSNRTKNRLSLC